MLQAQQNEVHPSHLELDGWALAVSKLQQEEQTSTAETQSDRLELCIVPRRLHQHRAPHLQQDAIQALL
jgi:hypothetical protein